MQQEKFRRVMFADLFPRSASLPEVKATGGQMKLTLTLNTIMEYSGF